MRRATRLEKRSSDTCLGSKETLGGMSMVSGAYPCRKSLHVYVSVRVSYEH